MYCRFIVAFLIFVVTLSPLGAIADDKQQEFAVELISQDLENDIHKYQIEGSSMEHLGFLDGEIVNAVQASVASIGDVVIFMCADEQCDGMYIKEVKAKTGGCYWLEGRSDIWEENNTKKQSMDSQSTYGWLCGGDIDIKGIVTDGNT